MLRFLLGRLAVLMLLCDSLVATVCQTIHRSQHFSSTVLEQCQVMFLARTKSSGNYLARQLIGDYLSFLSMSLLFSAIVATLLFLGRSQGHSVASIITISKMVSLWHNAFLPGK